MTIELKDVSKKFDGNCVLDKLNLVIEKEQITVILGPSGCGKTTLLNILSGIDKKFDGNVSLKNENISYVFQEDRLLPWLSVKENIEFVNLDITKQRVSELLVDLDIEKYIDSYPNTLSGGMKQRVSIARAYSYNSDVLLMDEPFKSLDILLKKDLMFKLYKIWNKKKNSIVIVTHDPLVAALLADKVIIFSKDPAKIVNEISLNKEKYSRFSDNKYIDKITNDIHRNFKE